VKDIESSLFSYGEKATEMSMHVFLAYEEIEDEDFFQYIKMKKSVWEERGITLDLNKFLANAEKNYKIRMQQVKWRAPSKKDEQLAVMKAELAKKHGNGNEVRDKISMEEKLKREKEKNPWKFVTPKDGEAKSKEVKGTTFHWCGKHGHWCGHSMNGCLGVGVNMRFCNNNNKRNKGRNETYNVENDD
jgi:hypothetical protein